MSSNLQKGEIIGVVYFSMDQYNNVQKGKGCQGGRKRLKIA